MEYQKIINLLGNIPNQPSKFRTRNRAKIIDERREGYKNKKIKVKTSILRSDVCDYSDADILMSGSLTIVGIGADDAAKRLDERYKVVVINNYALFIECMRGINNTQIDHAIYAGCCDAHVYFNKNTAKLIKKHEDVYDNIIEMNQLLQWLILNHPNPRLE